MDWFTLIVISVLLLAVAGELALIIHWGRLNRLAKLFKQLRDKQAETLEKLQEHWRAQEEWADSLTRLISDTSALLQAPARTKELTATGQPEEAHKALLTAAQALSASASTLKSGRPAAPEDAAGRLDAVAERFDRAIQALGKTVQAGFEVMAKDRRVLSEELAARSREQQEELRSALAQLQVTLRQAAEAQPRVVQPAVTAAPVEPAAVVSSTTQAAPVAPAVPVTPAAPAAPVAPVTPVEPAANDGQAAESPAPPAARESAAPAAAERAPRTAAAETSASPEPEDTNFEPLRRWVVSNLEQIMNRSLNQWSKPEDLLGDSPPGLSYTAKLLDPEAKLVLVGLDGDKRYLVLALPGGKIDKMNVEWFSTSQGGVGGRVERTVSPALLEAGTTGYRVVRRGVVKPD